MRTWEEIGRSVDEEITRLRAYLDGEVRPAAERRLAEALRAASKKLGDLAAELVPPAEKPS